MLAAAMIAWAVLAAVPAHADGAGEVYRFNRAQISDEALRGAVGILTLWSQDGSTRPLATFRPTTAGFSPLGTVEPERLQPLSVVGTGQDFEEGAFGSRKFIVTAASGTMVRVVSNPETGGGLWLDLEETRKSSWTAVFLEFAALSPSAGHVDPFRLWKGESRPFCPAPGAMDECTQRPRLPPDLLWVKEQRGDYVLIQAGSRDGNPPSELGWIPLHDAEGLLTVWFVYIDDC